MLQNHYTQFFFFKMAAVILSVTSILYDSDRVFYIFLTGNTVSNNYKYTHSSKKAVNLHLFYIDNHGEKTSNS